ncbi:MAG: 6,7-dimethyl-8-ribityllumazine synthase [Pseudomonadota bacterium]
MSDSHHPDRFLVIEARFYAEIADALFDGARAALDEAGAEYERYDVPGVLEIPAALAMILGADPRHYHGYVLLGCVIRGETSHYDIVAGDSARAVMDLTVQHRLALGNGILTVENEEQAWARADKARKDKGGDAARAAIAMAHLQHRITGTY